MLNQHKLLIVMRHAKAEKQEGNLSDFERPLAKRGKEDAATMMDYLKQKNVLPEYITASPSKRTKQTVQIIESELKIKSSKINFETGIYEASLSDLMHAIREIPENVNSAILVGHNPSVTCLIGHLTNNFVEHVSTAGIAVLKLNINNWQIVRSNCAELTLFKGPKDIKA